jgi:CheY-like chemotaxis protein
VGLRVLVTDDHPDQAEAIAILLRQAGYKVETATSGEQALAKASTFKPQVVILDIKMPYMDGFQTAQALKQQAGTADTAVYVAHTAFDERTITAAKLQQAGFQHYVRKPADIERFEELLAVIPRNVSANAGG